MAKYLEEALVNQKTKLGGAKKPHMDLGDHLEYIESLLERGGGSGSGSGSGSGGGSDGGSVDLLKPILTEGKAPVPNTGYVDKVFFNTKLTTDEVDSIIANANLHFTDGSEAPMYFILGAETGETGLILVIIDFSSITGETGSSWAIGDMFSNNMFYVSSSVAPLFDIQEAGWNASFFTSFDTGEVTINGNLVDTIEGMDFGKANNLLTNLIYLPESVDSGETEVAKSLTGQYKIVETNLKLDTESNASYTYDFISSINEDTKEISVIKNIEINTREDDIIEKTLTTYTNHNVKEIKEYVFYQCDSLTDVSFPKVERIYQYAFSGCTKLVNTNMPLVKNINEHAFYNCSSLIEVNFPVLEETYSNTFENCTSLQSFTAPMLQNVSDCMFKGCSSLKNITVPNVTQIESSAFSGCQSLVSIDVPLVKTINTYTFQGCTKLVNINLPEVEFLYGYPFINCSSLINIALPKATNISLSAFLNNNKLTEVYAPKVTSINSNAFNNCYSLIKLFIAQKDRVCELYAGAFENCSHILGQIKADYNPDGLKDGYIYVPASLLSQYKVAENWINHASQIIGHEDLEAGAALPDYTISSFTKQTWYSDEKLTTVVTSVATTGRYYCRLEA